jgi:hypothetical protein
MGYETSLHLVSVKIKDKSIPRVTRSLIGRRRGSLRFFLKRIVLDSEGFLMFKANNDGLDEYVPDEDENTVPAVYGKWCEAEDIASWLKLHAERGGRLILHSDEGDGEAWGWEFDGKGRMRALALRRAGNWE